MNNQILWSKNFISITLCNLFLFLSFYYLLVSLPIYAVQEIGATPSEAGLLITIFLLSAIVIRPFAGKWMIRFGKRMILFTSLGIFIFGSCLYLLPTTITGLLLVRLFHGIGFGMATTATGAIVTDFIPERRRGEGMGYYALSFNLAVVLGPFLALTAIQYWDQLTLFAIVILCSFLTLCAGLLLSFSKQERKTTYIPKRLDIFEKPAVKISIVAGLFAIIYSSILSFVPIYAKELNLLEAASYFFVVYAVVMLLSRPFTGRWFDKYGANVIIYPSIVLFSIGMLLLALSEATFTFLLSAAIIGLGWGTLFPCFQTISVQNSSSERRGLAMATFLNIFDLGIGVGSFIVGVVITKISLSSFYFYGSFLILFGIFIYHFMHGRVVLLKMHKSEKAL